MLNKSLGYDANVHSKHYRRVFVDVISIWTTFSPSLYQQSLGFAILSNPKSPWLAIDTSHNRRTLRRSSKHTFFHAIDTTRTRSKCWLPQAAAHGQKPWPTKI